jgi:hypothetical protein
LIRSLVSHFLLELGHQEVRSGVVDGDYGCSIVMQGLTLQAASVEFPRWIEEEYKLVVDSHSLTGLLAVRPT